MGCRSIITWYIDIPEEMKPFVNDYKMHLVEARKK